MSVPDQMASDHVVPRLLQTHLCCNHTSGHSMIGVWAKGMPLTCPNCSVSDRRSLLPRMWRSSLGEV